MKPTECVFESAIHDFKLKLGDLLTRNFRVESDGGKIEVPLSELIADGKANAKTSAYTVNRPAAGQSGLVLGGSGPVAPQAKLANLISEERQANNSSPNAVLYQKLLRMISSSNDMGVMSSQMSSLLANPVVKERLQRLHQQLLLNPGHFLPKFENIIRSDLGSASGEEAKLSGAALAQDLHDLKNYYARFGAVSSDKSTDESLKVASPVEQQQQQQQRLPTRVMDREFKRR